MSTNASTPDGATSTGEQQASVGAICTDCGDEHPLGDRSSVPTTTACPACGSKSYRSVTYGTSNVKADDERIRDAVKDIDGIGEGTTENVVAYFGYYTEFAAAGPDELMTIEGLGRTTVERIIESR